MSNSRIELKNLEKAAETAAKLKVVRHHITMYDPRSCTAKLEIFFGCGSGVSPAKYGTDAVLPTLRAYEQDYEAKLYSLGVNHGPSAENPWEKRKAVYRKVALEIQFAPEYKKYRDAIMADDAEAIEQFEAQHTSSNEEFAVFRDCVKNGQ